MIDDLMQILTETDPAYVLAVGGAAGIVAGAGVSYVVGKVFSRSRHDKREAVERNAARKHEIRVAELMYDGKKADVIIAEAELSKAQAPHQILHQ